MKSACWTSFEHVEFQALRNFGREQVKAICMDWADVHFCHAVHFTELLPAARDNPFFQFSGGLLGKRECNDVVWAGAVLDEVRHAPRDHFSLAGAGARAGGLNRLDGWPFSAIQ
jgi:hypothetical protein